MKELLWVTVVMLAGGLYAQWVYTDIPQWGIGLHAIGVGILFILLDRSKP